MVTLRKWLAAAALLLAATLAVPAEPPDVLFVTIDTLRADRMSAYGHERETSPNLDRLIDAGVRFDQARTVEPLTAPALVSMVTSLHPHVHGTSRNGLRMRPGLESLPKLLSARGYSTAAIVSNWTLKDKISGLAEHFEEYVELLKRKRWLGLISGEARCEDVTERALQWLSAHFQSRRETPYFLWVHYIEPHAPYKLHAEFREPLGILSEDPSDHDRYDTEIAEVDRSIGELLAGLKRLDESGNTLIVFASDHGESLGEHKYWGHGRNLYEPGLHIPMSITWPGRIEPGVIDAPASIIDLAPTVIGLLNLDAPSAFQGLDWTGVFDGAEEAPIDRVTRHQAHKGAVLSNHDSDAARRAGLLEVGLVREGRKEIVRVKSGRRRVFDLTDDPRELKDLAERKSDPTESLAVWTGIVKAGLTDADDLPPTPLDEETMARLRALGYAD